MIFRTIWHMLIVGPRGRRLGFGEVSRSRFRVWPTDLDILNHMNNGKYLSIMDIGRFDLIQRTGTWQLFRDEKWYPVVVGLTISYRRSLNPWQRFWIESKILGFDEQAVYLEQRFVRPNKNRRSEIYARAYVRARVLKQSGGLVSIEELIEKSGANLDELSVPEEVLKWGQTTRLPSAKTGYESVWE